MRWLGSTTLLSVAGQSSIKMASELSHQTVLGVLPNAGGGAVTVPLSSTATQFFVPESEQDCLGTNRRDSVRCSHEHQGRRSSALARFNHPFWRRGAEFNQDGLRIVAPNSAWCASKRRRRCCNSAAQFNRNSIFRTRSEQDCLGTNQCDSVRCSHEHQGRRSSALARFNHPFERRGAEFNQDGLRIVAPNSAWCASKRRRRCCNSAAPVQPQLNFSYQHRSRTASEPTGVTVFGVLTSTRGGAPVRWLGSTTLFGVAGQSSIKMASELSHQTVLGVLPNAGRGAVTVPLSSTATQFFVPALEQDCLGTNQCDSVRCSHEHQGRRSSALARFNHPF